jgi:hypothetical protein
MLSSIRPIAAAWQIILSWIVLVSSDQPIAAQGADDTALAAVFFENHIQPITGQNGRPEGQSDADATFLLLSDWVLPGRTHD